MFRTGRIALTPFIPDIIAKRAALTPGSTAFRDLLPGTSMSYLELDERARRAAGLMASLGVSAGDRIAILCRNRTEFFELLFACGKLGAILVPLNWRMPAAELLPLVNDAEPAVLLFGREDAATAAKLALSGMQTMALDDDGTNGYSNLRDQSESFMGRAKWPAAECWYLLYTSGTTGKPKAVIQTYGMAMANYVNIRQAMSIGAGDVTLNYLPHFHTAGINLVALPTLIEGGEVLIMPDFDLDRFVSLLEEGVLDTFFAVPAVYQQISLHPAFDSMDLSRIRNWACGGAPLPDELLNQYIVARCARLQWHGHDGNRSDRIHNGSGNG